MSILPGRSFSLNRARSALRSNVWPSLPPSRNVPKLGAHCTAQTHPAGRRFLLPSPSTGCLVATTSLVLATPPVAQIATKPRQEGHPALALDRQTSQRLFALSRWNAE